MKNDANKRILRTGIFTCCVLAVICIGSYGTIEKYRPQWLELLDAAIHPVTVPAIGFVDELPTLGASGGKFVLRGWALSKAGIDRVDLVLNGYARIPLTSGVIRRDVEQAHPGYPESAKAGFEGVIDRASWPSGFKTLELVVTDKAGGTTILTRRTVPPQFDIKDTWSDLLKSHELKRDDIFYFAIATSNLAGGGASDISDTFRPYESDTVKVGIRIQILYLRTTRGKAGDYAFDPDFPVTHKCGKRPIAEDNLNGVIDYAIKYQLPVLFTLNGGIWADAACDAPEWDINDLLEQDVNNDQWNEKNLVMADNALKDLPGSMDSPELGRQLTFNVYAEKNRHYKKRNLQKAAVIIREFATKHPSLFIGVNVDPDVYMNPFFGGSQWYDFNPGTVRQFREWLQGTGPYGGNVKKGQVDLSSYRIAKPKTLNEVNAISGQNFKHWEEVDPPRTFGVRFNPFWENPWFTEWEHFRRHLVKLHYDELSEWIGEIGIGKEFIYSAQGFMAPSRQSMPFAIHINSPAKNYDSGGMSIEGSIPSNGHLGAIIYGPSAANQIKMEGRNSLFSEFRRLDPNWAVVEHNTADLRMPKKMPGFSEAYQSLRDIHNYGARFISPMAWNGGRGISAGQPGFVSYTALRDTPLEDAIKNFMVDHANLPRRSRLWTFGAWTHADSDGWTHPSDNLAISKPSKFIVKPNSTGKVVLESPDELMFHPNEFSAIVVKAASPDSLRSIGVEAQTIDGGWVTLLPMADVTTFARKDSGLHLPLAANHASDRFRRIRLNLTTVDQKPIELQRIALYAR